ncbi:Ion channel [Jannaschia seosinensis]|uniref:Ion channel n=1 Tax=Jannaschia seosinensis TaxID=313367 RepID=A0A0M7B5M0_9RHOB|nr:potassium channel family protein [Jannaschia seosinensis]CUH11746.1 Ion channel [Jannaschia seosinensis]
MTASFMTLAGLIIVGATLWDVFRSLVRTPLSSGPFTTGAEKIACLGLLRLFHLTGRRRFLAAIGPVSVMARAFAVVLGLLLGWGLVFFAQADWVIVASPNRPADFWERVYFTGYTISTLGLGDVVPDGPVAQLSVAGGSLTGFMVLTFVVGSVSTLSQVIGARDTVISAMHAHAAAIAAGGAASHVLDKTLDQVVSPLAAVASAIQTLPVRHRMHAETETLALSRALDRLNTALASGSPADPRQCAAARSMDQILEALTASWLATDATDRRGRIDAFLAADHLDRD